MKRTIKFFIIFCIILKGIAYCEEIEIKNQDVELEELYKKIKQGEQINIYYHKETIIKEQTREEYLEHLVRELKTALKKGKKYGVLRRVEGNLVEIDKGSIHKVRERDVYKVYDSSGKYKGKLEIAAIADAVSIGEIYSEKNKFLPGDKIKFIGRRYYYKLGIEGGVELNNEYSDLTFMEPIYSGFGPKFEYIIKGGYGFFILLSYYAKETEKKSYISGYYSGYYYDLLDVKDDYIIVPFGINKYFNFPAWYSPFIGIGGGYKYSELEYSEQERNINGELIKDINLSEIKRSFIPYIQLGIQFASSAIISDIGIRCYYEPRQKFSNEEFKRIYENKILFIPYLSFSMGW